MILAFDSSYAMVSVALCDITSGYVQTLDRSDAKASAVLVHMIDTLVREVGWEHINTLALGVGPGTFTGVRSACAAAQALVLGKRLPCYVFSSLLALAQTAKMAVQCTGSNIADNGVQEYFVAMDARMQQVYCAHYRWQGRCWQTLQAPKTQAVEHCRVPETAIACGNAWDMHPHLVKPTNLLTLDYPKAQTLAQLVDCTEQSSVTYAQILPLYVRNNFAILPHLSEVSRR